MIHSVNLDPYSVNVGPHSVNVDPPSVNVEQHSVYVEPLAVNVGLHSVNVEPHSVNSSGGRFPPRGEFPAGKISSLGRLARWKDFLKGKKSGKFVQNQVYEL